MKFSDRLLILFCTSWAALDTNLSPTMSVDFRRPGGISSSDSVKIQMLCYDHKFVYLLSSPCFAFLQKVLLQSQWSPKQWREQLQRSYLKPVTSSVALYMWFLIAHLIPLASCCVLLEVSPLLPLNWLLSLANFSKLLL